MATQYPEFQGLDSNDQWVETCGEKNCPKKHNILKNNSMLLPNDQAMNWWDFLDVLVCYAESAEYGLCRKCSWCRYWYKNLLGEGVNLSMGLILLKLSY